MDAYVGIPFPRKSTIEITYLNIKIQIIAEPAKQTTQNPVFSLIKISGNGFFM